MHADIADISEVPPPKSFTIDSPAAVRAWVAEHAGLRPRFYDLFMPETEGGGLRFALGRGVAGAIMEAGPNGTGPYYWLEEGERGSTIEVACEDSTIPVPALQQVGPERLAAVLAHYVEHGGRAPGHWTDERGWTLRPTVTGNASPSRTPVARGHHIRALVERVGQGRARPMPPQSTIEALARAHDDDLAAYVLACAQHEGAPGIEIHDWWIEEPYPEGEHGIALGRTAQGSTIVGRPGGMVVVTELETGEQRMFSGLEAFVESMLSQAHALGTITDLDPISPETTAPPEPRISSPDRTIGAAMGG
ncbi:MAG: hypothetical protein K0V04_01895 [Deltaproteobacteria bacterium]|nr:hypothetical protein [Deltaproteobacteria bacterium]